HRAPAPSIANRHAKQLAYRLHRRTLHSTVDPAILRGELQPSGCRWRTPSTSVLGAASASSVSAVAETATYTRVRSDSEAVVRTATSSSCSPICLDRRCSPHPAWPECHLSASQLAGQTN